jgi:hypothetical protein
VAHIACSGVALLILCQPALAAEAQAPRVNGPKPATVEAFHRYIRLTEARLDARLESGSGFLWADTPERRARLQTGELICEPVTNHKTTYKPEVIASRLLRRNGNEFQVYLRLLKRNFLWRLDSYWMFQEADRGVYVECEAVSLTRDVPAALACLIRPIVRSLLREAVSNTLRPKTAELSDSRRRMSLHDEAHMIRFAVLRAGIDLIRTHVPGIGKAERTPNVT